MDEVKTTDAQEVPSAQGNEQAGKPAEVVTQPQPTVTELMETANKKELEIKRLQGLLTAEQKRGAPKAVLDKLNSRLDGMEETNAILRDYLERNLGETEMPSETPTKKTHLQTLKERRETEAKGSEGQPNLDPEAQKFIAYMLSQGLDVTDPIILEATDNGNKSPTESLKVLKAKLHETSKSEEKKRIAEGVEAKLKELGVASLGVLAPSAPVGDWRSKSPEEKLLLGVTGKK